MCKTWDLDKGILTIHGYNACNRLDRRQHVLTDELRQASLY